MRSMNNRAEKIARRVLSLNNSTIPIDIFDFIKKYAVIEEDNTIPFEYDAICMFNYEKPHIIYNGDRPLNRIRFTLAHELGHIMIPGHRSNIACNLKEHYENIYKVPLEELNDEIEEYFSREVEADLFASEILLPSFWIKSVVDKEKGYKNIVSKIQNETQLSYQAISIAVRPFLEPGMVVIAKYMDAKYVTISPSTIVNYEDTINENNKEELENKADSIDEFNLGAYEIKIYYLYKELKLKKRNVSSSKNSSQLLKECLSKYYNEDDAKKHFLSINGILGSINSRSRVKEMSEAEYFKIIDYRFRNRDCLNEILNTEEFELYISQKYYELKNK